MREILRIQIKEVYERKTFFSYLFVDLLSDLSYDEYIYRSKVLEYLNFSSFY